MESHRGLSANTVDAYSRAFERYLAFSKSTRVASVSATGADVGRYLAALQPGEVVLANATIQQLLTVVRLFHGYLMEEWTRSHKPAAQTSSGRAMVARHHKLSWIPNEEDWHSILAAARQESIRNRTMLAFAYDAGLRREGFAVSRVATSIRRDACSRFEPRVRRDSASALFLIPHRAASCLYAISNIAGRSATSVGRSFSPSHAVTTAIPSRYGVGRRSYSRLHAELASNASQRTHFAISV